MNAKLSGGYIGLVSLLISFTIIALLLWRSDLFTTAPVQTNTTQTSVLPAGGSSVEQDLQAVKAAERAKQMLEKDVPMQNALLGN